MTIPRAALGALLLLTVSCANVLPERGHSFNADPRTAIVYGRFGFVDNATSHGKFRMALQLSNEVTKDQLYVRFDENEPVACASIPPGRYKLTAFVATDMADKVLTGKQFGPEDKLDVQFTADAGTAIYLGDYSGYIKFYSYGALNTFETGLTEAANKFSRTTAAFHKSYRNLAALPAHSGFASTGN